MRKAAVLLNIVRERGMRGIEKALPCVRIAIVKSTMENMMVVHYVNLLESLVTRKLSCGVRRGVVGKVFE